MNVIWAKRWPIIGVALVAVAVRTAALGWTPLWTDELFTRFYPRMGFDYLWGEGFRAEPTSPLYYSLIAATERLFGVSTWSLRLPSMVGSLASIVLAWSLGRELFGRPGASLLAALFLALAPINVFYAAEARAYALQGAAIGLALLGFARLLRGSPGLGLYATGAVLAVWLHPTSGAVVVSFNLVALACVGTIGRAALIRWLGVNAVVGLLCLPLVPAVLWPAGGGTATDWIPALNRWSLEIVLGETLAGPAIGSRAPVVAEWGVAVLAALMLLPPWRPGMRVFVVLALVPALALILMIGISAGKPVLLNRTLAWLALPLSVALGGLLSQRPAVLGGAVAAAAAAALLVQAERGAAAKEDWPGLFAQMGDLSPPTMLVLAAHTPPAAVAVYAPGAAAPVRLDDGKPPMPETTVIPRLFGTPTISLADMAAAIRAGRNTWLIYRRSEWPWVQHELAQLPTPVQTLQSEPGTNPALRAVRW